VVKTQEEVKPWAKKAYCGNSHARSPWGVRTMEMHALTLFLLLKIAMGVALFLGGSLVGAC
jgi:hypothetical protein